MIVKKSPVCIPCAAIPIDGVAKKEFVNAIVVPDADEVISSPVSTLFSKFTVNFKSCTFALTLESSQTIYI